MPNDYVTGRAARISVTIPSGSAPLRRRRLSAINPVCGGLDNEASTGAGWPFDGERKCKGGIGEREVNTDRDGVFRVVVHFPGIERRYCH